jgi:hypothetical protein
VELFAEVNNIPARVSGSSVSGQFAILVGRAACPTAVILTNRLVSSLAPPNQPITDFSADLTF